MRMSHIIVLKWVMACMVMIGKGQKGRPLMIGQGFLALECLVAHRTVEVIKYGLLFFFLLLTLLTCLLDPVGLFNFQSSLQASLPVLLPPATNTTPALLIAVPNSAVSLAPTILLAHSLAVAFTYVLLLLRLYSACQSLFGPDEPPVAMRVA